MYLLQQKARKPNWRSTLLGPLEGYTRLETYDCAKCAPKLHSL